MPETTPVILSEPRPGDAEQQELFESVTKALANREAVDLTVIPHLYDLDPAGPTMGFLREIEGPMIVIAWLFPRAAFWTLRTAGVDGQLGHPDESPNDKDRPIWCLEMHPRIDAKSVLDDVDRIVTGGIPRIAGSPEKSEPRRREEGTRERWYPVIDRDRCSGCLECLNFCLFGVYGMDSRDSILIEQPDACRAGCPACSRICPEGAIMFPQHADPAIAGDAEASLEGLKLDLSQLFSGADAAALAVAERDRAVEQMKSQPKSAGGDRLDNLVDELDEMDI